MKDFAVIGLGRFGTHLALRLADNGHTVMAVDQDPRRVQAVSDRLAHVVEGDVTEQQLLYELGLTNFDIVIVALASNVEASVLTTLMLKDMGVNYVVAKAASSAHQKALERIGADRVVFPEKDVARRLGDSLGSAHILDMLPVDGEVSVVEMSAAPAWIDRSLAELDFRNRYGVTIVAMKRGDTVEMALGPSTTIHADDVLIAVGEDERIRQLQE